MFPVPAGGDGARARVHMPRTLSPRCGKVMQRYETAHGALLDDVVCGRPEGHNGQCRSEQSLAKIRRWQKDNWYRYNGEKRKQERRRASLARALREIDGYRRSAS